MQAIESRSQLGWLNKRLGTGGATTRKIYAWSREFRHRKELAERRRQVSALPTDPKLSISSAQGYAVIPAGQISEAEEIAKISQRLVDTALADPAITNAISERRKTQLLTGLLTEKDLTSDSPFIRFALRPDLLRGIADYLGFLPLLATIDVWGSIPSAELANSQLYHCDWANLRQVKVFVHGSDVGPDSGPLVVMGATESESVRRQVGYRWRGKRYRVTDEKMKSLGHESDGQALLGPAGSVAMVDTCRCFHYGSRLSKPGTTRALCMMRFTLPSEFASPSNPADRAPLRHLATPDMSRVERMVLGDLS